MNKQRRADGIERNKGQEKRSLSRFLVGGRSVLDWLARLMVDSRALVTTRSTPSLRHLASRHPGQCTDRCGQSIFVRASNLVALVTLRRIATLHAGPVFRCSRTNRRWSEGPIQEVHLSNFAADLPMDAPCFKMLFVRNIRV